MLRKGFCKGMVEFIQSQGSRTLLPVVLVVADEESPYYVPELLITLLHSYYNAWQTITTNPRSTLN